MKWRSLLCFAVTLCASAAFAQPENPEVRRIAQQFYRDWDAKVAKGDIKGLMALLHPEFVQIDANGNRTNCEQVKKQFAGMMQTVRDPRSTIRVDKVEGTPQEFIAWVTMTVDFKIKDRNTWKPMRFTEKFAETIVRTPQGYRFLMSQSFPREYPR